MNDPFIVYYSSPSGNTQKFVEKLGIANSRIPHSMQEDLFINVPYVLITPTYGGLTNKNRHSNAVPKQVVKFLNYTNNRLGIRGVIASGNANFGIEYGLAGEVISRKCMVPYLYRFELMGTVEDVLCVRQGLRQLWQDNLKNNEKILPSVAI